MALRTLSGPMAISQRDSLYYSESGFTLAEIAVALALLAATLATLIGLQSSAVQRSIDNRANVEAMLFARQILSQLEIEDEPPEEQDTQGPLSDFIDTTDDSEFRDQLEANYRYQVRLKVEVWSLPDSPEALKRITLTITWGPSATEQLNIFYFLPNT